MRAHILRLTPAIPSQLAPLAQLRRGSAAPWINRRLHFVECSTHGTLFHVSHCTAESIPLGDGDATQLSGTVASGSLEQRSIVTTAD
jgi:hypothetical protein